MQQVHIFSDIENNFTDTRTFKEKSADILSMMVKDLFFGVQTIYNQYFTPQEFYDSYCYLDKEKLEWQENEGLILLIHGLLGHPSHWVGHVEEIKKGSINFLINAPFVFKQGNCSLEEAAGPILEIAKQYILDNPGKPICIFSASNGARISNYIDIHLREYNVNMIISSIAGAHLGSKKMNFINQVPIIRSFFDENLRSELSYESDHAKDMIESLRRKIGMGTREYYFFASTEDYLVTPYTSSLPNLFQKEKYFLIHGEGHGSIPFKVRKTQVQFCINRLSRFIK